MRRSKFSSLPNLILIATRRQAITDIKCSLVSKRRFCGRPSPRPSALGELRHLLQHDRPEISLALLAREEVEDGEPQLPRELHDRASRRGSRATGRGMWPQLLLAKHSP